MSAPPLGVISPPPIMRIVARFVRTGMKLQLLEVKAPRQATIKVTCSTHACPHALRRHVTAANGNGSRWVKFRAGIRPIACPSG